MRRSRARPKSTDTTITIPVSSLSVGAQSANAFSGWVSPATTVFSRTAYGTTAKYIASADATKMMAVSSAISRDQEVTTYAAGYSSVYLRWMPGGRAIYFYAQPDFNAYGLYILNGVTEGTFVANGSVQGVGFSSSGGTLFSTPAVGSIPGYSTTSAAGHTWTVGVEGFEIYLKYNGVEFYRVTSLHHLTPGKIALHSANDSASRGFRDVSAVHKVSKPLYSDITTKLFDLRDFGLKPNVSTTGSINVGVSATTLTVASAVGFSVGDEICIATGGEAGGGVPGERGVGGQWPSLLYATTAARNSDTTQVTNKVCGVLANGLAYQWNGSAWVAYAGNLARYLDKIVPKALVTTITAIAGNTLTLATAATVSTTNANVYFSNAALWNAKIDPNTNGMAQQPGCTIYYAPGAWVFANKPIQAYQSVNSLTLLGAGKTSTIILSPTGTREAGFLVGNCATPRVANFGFTGNTRADKGFMFGFDATTDQWAASTSFIRMSVCTAPLIENIRGVNYSNAVSEISLGNNGVQRNIDVVHETGHKQYFQWAVNIADSTNCISEDITFDGPWLFKGLESFRSNGSILRRATGRNVVISSNSNTDLTVQDCSIVYESGCADSPFNAGQPLGIIYPDPREPLVNLNSNIDNTSGSTGGGGIVFQNCDFDVQGRIWTGFGFWLYGMSGTVDNVNIRGKYPTKPVTSPSGRVTMPNLGADRCQFLRSDEAGKTILIDGVRIGGTYVSSPVATGGTGTTIRNSVLDNQAALGTQTNNITNAAYNALP